MSAEIASDNAGVGSAFDPALPRSPAGPYNPWLIAVVVSLAAFMEVLDTTIANVSLSHIAGSLGASQDQSTWVLTSYLVSNTVVLPISGWLAQVLGRKRFYLICVGLFTLSSVGCAFATTLPMMICARIAQGLGGGGLQPTTQSMLADSFPPEKRSQAFALFGLTVIAAPTVGPIIGGWLTDNLSWHWIFLINLPVGLVAFTLISVFVTEAPALIADRARLLREGFRLDYFGLFLTAVGFGTLQIFLDKFQEDDGFSSSFIIGAFAVTVTAISLLAVWEWDHPQPVINLRLFRIPNFLIGNLILFFVGFMLLSSTQLLPQLTQTLLGYDSETSGLVLAPGGVATILLMPALGLLTGRIGNPKWLMIAGFVSLGLAMLLFSNLAPDASYRTLATLRVLQALSFPFLFIPASAICYVGVPGEQFGEASALISQTRNIGGSIGISVITTMLAWRTQFHHARLAEAITPYGSLHGMKVPQILGVVQSQAAFMSYLDMFRIVGVIALLLWPILLFVRPPNRAASRS